MALVDTTWYCNFGNGTSTGYYAVTVRPQNAAVAAGVLRRQFSAPAVGSERVFVCIIAGTTANVTDATWVLTRGAKTTDGTVTWMECTGQAALNGDLANTSTWAQVKAATPAVLGQIIKRSNNASYQICTTAGAMSASEPAFSDTAGTTTTDTTAVWTSLGPVGNFTGGQAPFARLASVFGASWFIAGNTVYVGNNHAESQTTIITITLTSSVTVIGRALCHNAAGSYPPTSLTTGATISTTGAVNFAISASGAFYFYGLTFKSAVGQTGNQTFSLQAGSSWFYFDNCSFEIATTGSTASLNAGGTIGGFIAFNSTTVKFANAAQTINVIGQFYWQNTGPILVSGSLVPNALISNSVNAFDAVVLEAIDLSQLTGAINASAGASAQGNLLVKDCKLNASTTVNTPIGPGSTIQLVRADSGATAYKSARYQYEGTETTETSITRVGGAVDPTGQAQSRKIVTTANSQWLRPFKAEPFAIWNARTGANVTVTVYGTISAGALPNNDDIWMEAEYLGSATDPLGKIVTTTKATLLSSNAAVVSDSSTWNTPYTTFDGTQTGVTMSNGNRTVTHNNTTDHQGAMSVTYVDVGKFYFEVLFNQITYTASPNLGIILSGGTFLNAGSGFNTTSVFGGGAIFSHTTNTGKTIGSWVTGDTICVAIDLNARLAWFRTNNGNWNGDAAANPATGTGGVAIAVGLFAPFIRFGALSINDAITGNFGQTAFTYTRPAGFGNWSVGWSPFKLTTTLSSPQPGLAGYIHVRIRAANPTTTYYIDPQVTLS